MPLTGRCFSSSDCWPFSRALGSALRRRSNCNIFTIEWKLFFLFFLFLFFLSPTAEAVVFRYQVGKTLRKAYLTSIYAFFLRGGGEFEKGASVSFADQIIVLLVIITIRQANTFYSANNYDTNNLSFSPKNHLAINSSFVFQDIFGKDFAVSIAIC